MKLRLFTLLNRVTNKTNNEYFSSKPEAKEARDQMNAAGAPVWCVAPGPDHWKNSNVVKAS